MGTLALSIWIIIKPPSDVDLPDFVWYEQTLIDSPHEAHRQHGNIIARPEKLQYRPSQTNPSELKHVHNRNDAVGTRLPNLPHCAGIRHAQHKDSLEPAKSHGLPLRRRGRHSRSGIIQRLPVLHHPLFRHRLPHLHSPNCSRIDVRWLAVPQH